MLETGRKAVLARWTELRTWPLQRYLRIGKKLLFRSAIYLTLLQLSFLFLLPLLYILSNSIKPISDFIDPTKVWIPSRIEWSNFARAWEGMDFARGLKNTLTIVIPALIGQLLSCAVAGYGFGRYRFPGSGILFALILITLIVPPQTIIISLYSLFHGFGWLNTPMPFVVPAFFGQGLRGALFVLIFMQFFRSLPREMEEAARIDGAGAMRIFLQIMLPLVKPAIVIVVIFSFIWHWNDFYQPSLFINNGELTTLAVKLDTLIWALNSPNGHHVAKDLTEPILLAGCFLIVAPLFIIFLFAQRHLTEGIERTGIVE